MIQLQYLHIPNHQRRRTDKNKTKQAKKIIFINTFAFRDIDSEQTMMWLVSLRSARLTM